MPAGGTKKGDPFNGGKSTSEQVLTMRSFSSIMMGAAVLGLGFVAAAGCGQSTVTGCPRAVGVFHGQYSYITGTCEPQFQGRTLTLDKDDPGNTVRKVNNLSDSVTTEINLIGCTIGMTQQITDTGGTKKISEVSGDLDVEDASALSGQILRTEYMPDGTTIRCSGRYNATYSLETAPVGGAAQHALTAQ
jgi:hypothetical protein